jgi:hypothetical protein
MMKAGINKEARMKTINVYEVRFINPMIPGNLGKFIVEAKNEYAAVCEANMVFFNHSKNLNEFWVKESDEKAYKTADNWGSVFRYKLINAPVPGYKIVECLATKKA